MDEGTICRSQPRAAVIFKSVSSRGTVFLLSKRAMTDWARQAASARSFCVIPLLWRCAIRLSIITAQSLCIGYAPCRYAVLVQIFRGNIDFPIFPDSYAVIDINSVENGFIPQRCKCRRTKLWEKIEDFGFSGIEPDP